ncbi:Formate dehydrogenase region TAT target [Vibrio mytili]
MSHIDREASASESLPTGKEAMMKDNNEINKSRRDILKGITSAAVAGAVVAGTTKAAAASEKVEPSENEVKTKGYRETQHIRDYYDTL